MNNYLITIFCLLFFIRPALSQERDIENVNHFPIKIEENKPNKKIISNNPKKKAQIGKLFANTDFNVLIGATQFYGDIKENDWLPAYEESNDFFEMKYAIEISLKKKIHPIFSLQASIITGKFGGLRRQREGDTFHELHDLEYNLYEDDGENNGEYFVTDFKEADIQVLLNLSNTIGLFEHLKSTNYDLFLKAGIGMNVFNSVNRNIASGNYIYSYGYVDEEQYGGNIKQSFADSPRELVYIYGLTLDYNINEKFSLILDLTKRKGNTDYWDTYNNFAKNDHFIFYSIGTSYNIGGEYKKEEWISPLEDLQSNLNQTNAKIQWLSEDSDHDGVVDAFDKEINTPMGVSIDGSGSALDVDMDNVPDYLDADPFSSRGAIVDQNGVEFDSDNDGVPDSRDLESNTRIGSIVNQYGIRVSGDINSSSTSYLPSIYFEKGSYYINQSNMKRLANIAIIMKSNSHIKLNVIGNTDKTGTSESNKRLALKRAKEVIKYLSSNFGINEKRFIIQNNGDENPLSNSANDKNQPEFKNILEEVNRRVDFEIIY